MSYALLFKSLDINRADNMVNGELAIFDQTQSANIQAIPLTATPLVPLQHAAITRL